MKRVKKLGIYGGTFDPFHIGHYKAANAFAELLKLDKLLLMPAKIPPHKQVREDDDPQKRLEMLQAQFKGHDIIEPCDYELTQKGISYSVLTLRHFSQYAEELYMLVGTDMFLTLDRWYLSEEIFSLCCVVCFAREDDSEKYKQMIEKKAEYEKKFNARIILPEYEPLEMSSTYVKQIITDGDDASSLLPHKVYKYIIDNGMYKGKYSEKDIEFLKGKIGDYVSGVRLEHVLSVEECAHEICKVQGIGGQYCLKVRIAALLHDIAKAYDDGRQLDLARRLGTKLSENDINAPKTLHALNGAYLAKKEFPDIVDDDIFGMIKYHCTGKPDMTNGEKIVFLADYAEPKRQHASCISVRNAYFDNNNEKNLQYRLDTAVFLAYDLTVGFLKHKGCFIHPDTLDGYEQIKEAIENGKG